MKKKLINFNNSVYIFILISIFVLMQSCIKDPPEAITELKINNNSNHLIEGKVYVNNNIIEHFNLQAESTRIIKTDGGKGGNFSFEPFENADSVVVVYDNTYSITHYKDNTQNGASKSILKLSNWVKLKEEKYYWEYQYTFNEDDYNEASQ